MITRLLFLFLFILALDYYTFRALNLTAQSWSNNARNVAYFIFWGITVLFFIYMIFSRYLDVWHLSKDTERLIDTLFVFSILFKVIFAGFVFLEDIRRMIAYVYQLFKVGGSEAAISGRRPFMINLGLVAGAIPFGFLTYGMIRNPYRYKIHRQRIPLTNLPQGLEGLKIVQISDIHSGSFYNHSAVEKGVDMILAENPDLILFTGDLVNSTTPELAPYMDIFSRLEAPYGVYSVLGNHDYGDYHTWPSKEAKQANMELLKKYQADMGWKLLLNEHQILTINGAPLALIGVENTSASHNFRSRGDLTMATDGIPADTTKILLSHDPSHWDAEIRPKFPNIQLTLSGHTHGFQFGIEIPGFKWSPSQYIYEQWAGLYRKGSQMIYVNRGYGFLGYPGRVGILPEITVIELTNDTTHR